MYATNWKKVDDSYDRIMEGDILSMKIGSELLFSHGKMGVQYIITLKKNSNNNKKKYIILSVGKTVNTWN